MSAIEKLEKKRKYRQELARQFSLRLKIKLREKELPEHETNRILGLIIKSRLVFEMNLFTLARIIDTAEHPNDHVTHLLLPRKAHGGLESLNTLGMDGRDYLQLLASCALTVAVYDFLNAKAV